MSALISECPGGSTYLGNSVYEAADGENALDCATRVLADSALCASHAADLTDVLATLADDGRGLCTRDDRTHVKPAGLVALVVVRRLRAGPVAVRSAVGEVGLDRLSLEDLVGGSSAIHRRGRIRYHSIALLVSGLCDRLGGILR